MKVGRIDVTRRQPKIEDKKLRGNYPMEPANASAHPSKKSLSGERFAVAGLVMQWKRFSSTGTRQKPVETIVLSSTHRLSEKVSEQLLDAYKKARPDMIMVQVTALKPKELQPAELLSTASYMPSEMIEYQPDGQKPVRLAASAKYAELRI
jgi:hypothetical protein